MAKRKFVLGRFILFLIFVGSAVWFYTEMSKRVVEYNARKEKNMAALISYFDFRDKDFYKKKNEAKPQEKKSR